MTSGAKTILKLIVSLAVPQLVGLAGAFFTLPAIDAWYRGLEKPEFTPPPAVFGPTWTLLYFLMGAAFFLVWQRTPGNPDTRTGMIFFGIQLALNLVWSWLFFGLRSPLLGLIDIAVLWVAIAVTMVYFFRVSRTAGALLVPYFLWVSFAAVLNFSIWELNR